MPGFDCPTSTCTDTIRWQVLFRRKAAPAQDTNVFADSGCPADEVLPGGGCGRPQARHAGRGLAGYRDSSPGGQGRGQLHAWVPLRAGPRAGGRRPELREEGVRASVWFDSVAEMNVQPCGLCHGGPFNGSDWLKQTDLEFQEDEARPYWNAGNSVLGFAEKKFFNTVTHERSDGDFSRCGRPPATGRTSSGWWRVAARRGEGGAGTMALARFMAMVHEDRADNPLKPLAYAIASSFRADKFGGKTCVGGTAAPGTPCTENVDCAGGGTCGGMSCGAAPHPVWRAPPIRSAGGWRQRSPPFGKKDARRTHAMPSRHTRDTADAWNAAVAEGVEYNGTGLLRRGSRYATLLRMRSARTATAVPRAASFAERTPSAPAAANVSVPDCKNVSCEWETRNVGRFCVGGTNQASPAPNPGDLHGRGAVSGAAHGAGHRAQGGLLYAVDGRQRQGPSRKACTGGTTPGAVCDTNDDCPGSGLCTALPSQLISAPDAPIAVALTLTDCAARATRCDHGSEGQMLPAFLGRSQWQRL